MKRFQLGHQTKDRWERWAYLAGARAQHQEAKVADLARFGFEEAVLVAADDAVADLGAAGQRRRRLDVVVRRRHAHPHLRHGVHFAHAEPRGQTNEKSCFIFQLGLVLDWSIRVALIGYRRTAPTNQGAAALGP